MNPENRPSFMQHASIQEDALPFRAFERAHRRMRLAQVELAAAHQELDKAYAAMLKVGYAIRGAELADEIDARAPVPPESFRAEDRADELVAELAA